MNALLRKMGHTSSYTEDGAAAVPMFEDNCTSEQDSYDLIFMDGEMPVMDDFEAVRRIREFEQSQGLEAQAIVAHTAHAVEDRLQGCLQVSMDDYLLKPITRETLSHTIEQWAGKTAKPLQ